MDPSPCSGLLGVSSIDSGQLDILEMQITPGKPEILKSEIPIWDQNIFFEPVYAEKLMCPSCFGILLILGFSGRDHAACMTRMSRTPHL